MEKQSYFYILVVLSMASAYGSASSAQIESCHKFYKLERVTKSATGVETSQLRERYRELEQKLYWKSYIEDTVDVTQLIHKNHQQRNIEKGAPIRNFELFGLENYKAFVEARDYLNGIPEGSLQLSPEIIKTTHAKSAEYLTKSQNLLQKTIDLFGGKFQPGEFKKRNNRGEDPLFNPLTEEQHQALIANPYTKFVELPWPLSRPDKRRGYIVYGQKDNVEKDIKELCDWVNTQLPGIRNGTIDPIEVAATFQWKYVSIHPMVDGNGRTSMLIANRILAEGDLPPVMMTYSGYDIYHSPSQWAAKIRESVLDFEDFIQDKNFKDSLEKQTPNLHMSNMADGPRFSLTQDVREGVRDSEKKRREKAPLIYMNEKLGERWKYLKRELFADRESEEVILGGERFIAMMDGFFYNKYGIPFELRKSSAQQWELYPVSEVVAQLYPLGGKIADKRSFRRGFNLFMKGHFQEFFKFLKQYDKNQNVGNQVKVHNYEVIAKANKEGAMMAYDWQRSLFASALEIKETDPVLVLAQTRGYTTQFEKSVHFGHKTNIHEVLAQYQLMDLKYFQYGEYAKSKGWEHEASVILASREKLFLAAKTLLEGRVAELNKALKSSPDKLPSSQEWNFFVAYYKASPMKYSSFAEYASSKDNSSITLIRSDRGYARYVGFVSNVLFRELFDKMPLAEQVRGYFNKLVMAMKADSPTEAQQKLIQFSPVAKLIEAQGKNGRRMLFNFNELIQTSKFDTRGMAEEFERMYLEQFLHAVNDAFKSNISLSTNTAIYIRSKSVSENGAEAKDVIPFTFDAKDGRVYFIKFNKNTVAFNDASKYFRQYEVLYPRYASPFRISDSFSTDFFAADGPAPKTKEELKQKETFELALVSVQTN